MDFAADAVADFVAPPPIPTAAKAPDTSGPSFDDHLQQDARDARNTHADDARDARAAARADQADRAADRSAAREDAADDAADAAAAHDDHTRQPADSERAAHDHADPERPAAHNAQAPAPLLVQLIAASAQQPQRDQQAQQLAPPAAVTSPQAPPPEAQIVLAETTPATQSTNTPSKKAPAREPKTAKIEASPKPESAQAPQTAESAAASAPAAAPQAPAPSIDAEADTSAPGIGAVAGGGTHDGPARAPKAEANAGAKFEAPAQPERAAPSEDGATKSTPAPTSAGKTAPARETFVTAQTATAETPAPASTLDHIPVLAASASTPSAITAQHAAADQSGLRDAPVAAQVGHEIVRRFDGANTSFDIRLDPPELGRVEVRLEVSRDQRVTATVSADNPQALHELARHARDLEQTLQSAGLELSDRGLSFDLRQGSDGRQQANNDTAPSFSNTRGGETQSEQQTTPARPRLESWRGVRLDMMV